MIKMLEVLISNDMCKKRACYLSKINWNEKAFNLQEVAKELDLGLDSFVWDDNQLKEQDETLLPQVLWMFLTIFPNGQDY